MFRRIGTDRFRAILLVGIMLSGCQHATTREGLLEQTTADAHLSSHQLRILVSDFAIRAASQVEEDADQILARTSDPRIRKNALRWKINGTTAVYRAATRPDPLAAYLDLWILNRQTASLLLRPAPTPLFGPHQEIALGTCRELELHLRHIYDVLGTELPLDEDFVDAFATDFPVTSLYFDRESLSTRYIEAVEEPTRELFEVVSRLQENLDELQKLSLVYADHLPKQARWEAELLLLDIAEIDAIARPLDDFTVASTSMARMATTAEHLPAVLGQERFALERLIQHERRESLAALEQMRTATLGDLQKERVALLDAVGHERTIVLDALREERFAIGEQLSAEVGAALASVDTITDERTREIGQEGQHLVDHFFRRLLQLCAAAGLVATCFLITRHFRRRWAYRDLAVDSVESSVVRFDAGQDADNRGRRRAA